MKVAVVGAGIFGTTAAMMLAKEGYYVDLFEKESEILCAASGINQFRLHRGYHYPRSVETAISSRRAEVAFRKEYAEAVVEEHEHYYLIAAKDSLVSREGFLNFCKICDLEVTETHFPQAVPGTIELAVKVQESLIDPVILRAVIIRRLKQRGVRIHLGTKFALPAAGFDLIVNCTYALLNSVREKGANRRKKYQFELCEKPLVRLPPTLTGKSIVVIDGPFFCLDPFGHTDLHLIGNVVHAIHASNIGFFPLIPKEFTPFLNKGLIRNPPITNFKKFIKSASTFIPEMTKAEHMGSFYTIRAVLPNVEATDERPTIVSQINEHLVEVFSGKIGNCVEAAEEIVEIARHYSAVARQLSFAEHGGHNALSSPRSKRQTLHRPKATFGQL